MQHSEVKLGVALGGGAVRGAAHLGVLDVLDQAGYKPSALSGTSIGAFVAALYAFGQSPQQILDGIRQLKFFDIASLRLNKLGLMSHEDMGDLLVQAIGDKKIEDAPIPLALVATDLAAGKAVVMREGSLRQAVLASTCVPGLFTPVEHNGCLLVDGGLVENVPVSRLRELGANVVLGVNLNAATEYGKPEDITGVIGNSIDIAIDTTTRIQLGAADVVVNLALSQFDRSDPKGIPVLYQAGVEAAKAALPQLETALDEASPSVMERLERQAREFLRDYWPDK